MLFRVDTGAMSQIQRAGREQALPISSKDAAHPVAQGNYG